LIRRIQTTSFARGKRRKANTNHHHHAIVLPSCLPTKASKRMARRKVKNHWFVSVAVPKERRGAQMFARRTKFFPTEDDAKQFAKEMLSEKHHVFAGTLLGAHLPVRRLISSSQLYSWVGVKESDLDLS
jgi:hypothetical protein